MSKKQTIDTETEVLVGSMYNKLCIMHTVSMDINLSIHINNNYYYTGCSKVKWAKLKNIILKPQNMKNISFGGMSLQEERSKN